MAKAKATKEQENGVMETSAPTSAQPAQPGMPLFFKQPAVLDKERHAKAGVVTTTNYGFAKQTNSMALNVIEFIEAAKFYPVVFTDPANPFPAAIVGLEKENYYVDVKGEWKADHYIPAYARQYPFIFFQQPGTDTFFLSVDEGAPHFRANGGEGATPLYNADGTPTDLTKNALQFCSDYYQQHVITRNFCEDLTKHKLLVPYQSQAQFKSGRIVSLAQFMIIDEQAFNSLPDDVFLDFKKKGWLPFIYLALASASNWKRLASYGE
jgi:hypothetical protein